MKITSLIPLILLLVSVGFFSPADAEQPTISIIPKGMDVAMNPLLLEPGFSVECLNFDLSKTKNGITIRDGFTVLTQKSPSSGTVYNGLYGYVMRDGVKRLLGTYTVGYFDRFGYSDKYDDSIKTDGFNFLYKAATPQWAIYNDIAILTNGYNRPIRIKGTSVKPLVEAAPGYFEFAAMPESTTTANLMDGTYHYAWKGNRPCSYTTFNGLVGPSYPIVVDSDWVCVFAPPEIGYSKNIQVDPDSLCNPDSSVYKLYRTRGNSAWNDSLFYIMTCTLEIGQSNIYWVDTVPDALLGSGAFTHTAGDTLYDGINIVTADTTGVTDSRPGAVGYTRSDPNAADVAILGIAENMDSIQVNNWVYGVCFYDSATGMVSPMGPEMKIAATLSNDTCRDSAILLTLPALSEEENHLWRILYRDREYDATPNILDSSWVDDLYEPTQTDIFGNKYCSFPDNKITYNGKTMCRPWETYFFNVGFTYDADRIGWFALDTFKLVTDSVYIDTVEFGILEARGGDGYSGISSAKQFSNPTVLNDRVYFSQGNRVYYTIVGEPAILANSFDVNPNDGDEITALHASGDVLDVFKNNSMYRVKEIGFELHVVQVTNQEIIQGIGCIAPQSVVDLPGGGIAWLHTSGIYALTSHLQSPYKESGGNMPRISDPIQPHLDKYSISDLRECFAWITEDYRNLCFSFPTLDTTYVYSLNGGGWAKWDFAVRQATKYDSSYYAGIRPSSNVIFIQNSRDSIFKYGGVKLDLLDSLASVWKSGPLFVSPDYGKLTAYGLWRESNDAEPLYVIFTNHDGVSTAANDTITDTANYRYRIKEVSLEEAFYYQIKILGDGSSNLVSGDPGVDSLAIQRLDLWYKPKTSEAIKY